MHSARGWKHMKSSHSGWCWKCEIPRRLDSHINHIIKIQIIKFCENKEDGATNSDWEFKTNKKKLYQRDATWTASQIQRAYQARGGGDGF